MPSGLGSAGLALRSLPLPNLLWTPFWQRRSQSFFQSGPYPAELCVIVLLDGFQCVENSGVDLQLRFLRQSNHVFQVLLGHQMFYFIQPQNNEMKRAVNQEHLAVDVLPFTARHRDSHFLHLVSLA
ncbi:MAG TPA: hypothetical protein VJW20_07340 [Candidatus Angelobacter sp.]|nr:hypothetical protein [Candidatus Angelobacter sp.]